MCIFFCNLKEKDHIRRNKNGKKKGIFICEISIIILICQKLGLVGPLQQKINLPSSKYHFVSIKYWFTLTNTFWKLKLLVRPLKYRFIKFLILVRFSQHLINTDKYKN